MRDTPHASEGTENERRDYQLHGGDNWYWFDPDDGRYITLEYLPNVAHLSIEGWVNTISGNASIASHEQWSPDHPQPDNEITADGPSFKQGASCELTVVAENAGTLSVTVTGFSNETAALECPGDKTTLTYDLGGAPDPAMGPIPFYLVGTSGEAEFNNEASDGLRIHAAWITGESYDPGFSITATPDHGAAALETTIAVQSDAVIY